jgi:AcrR family transcriptional regulator
VRLEQYGGDVTAAADEAEPVLHTKIRRAALSLFLEQGLQETTLRQIAERAQTSRAQLYEHFRTKDEIVRSIARRQAEGTGEILRWVNTQHHSRDLPERAVQRWVDSISSDDLQEIRFAVAYPAAFGSGGFGTFPYMRPLAAELLGPPDPSYAQLLLIAMAFQSVFSAVLAARDAEIPDSDVLAAARTMAGALAKAATGGDGDRLTAE